MNLPAGSARAGAVQETRWQRTEEETIGGDLRAAGRVASGAGAGDSAHGAGILRRGDVLAPTARRSEPFAIRCCRIDPHRKGQTRAWRRRGDTWISPSASWAKRFDALGANRGEIEVKLFGGADVLRVARDSRVASHGRQDERAIGRWRFSREEGYAVIAQRLGGPNRDSHRFSDDQRRGKAAEVVGAARARREAAQGEWALAKIRVSDRGRFGRGSADTGAGASDPIRRSK